MRHLVFVLLFVGSSAFAQSSTAYRQRTFEGRVGTYPVSLTITSYDGIWQGTLVYARSGKPSTVVGGGNNSQFDIDEFDGKGLITGSFQGKSATKVGVYTGTWSSVQRTNTLPFTLRQTGQKTISPPRYTNLTGTYTYSYGDDLGSGQLNVVQTAPDKLTLEISASGPAPGYNQAFIPKKVFTLNNGQVVWENTDFPNCQVSITFSDGGAGVSQTGTSIDCGFGLNATLSGNYVKTSSKPPVFQDF